MRKMVLKGFKSDVCHSKMKPHEIDFVSKSMEEVMKGLEAIKSGYKVRVPGGGEIDSNEVQIKSKQPELLQGILHSFHGSLNSSPARRGRGNTSCIPMFNGESSRAFLSWLYEVECFFDGKCYSEKMKLEMVLFCLKGFALLWYNGLKLSRMVKRKDNVSTWCELKSYMKQNFLPSSILDKLWIELKTLKQNSFSVNEYAKLFEKLHLICDEDVDCVQKGVRFYHGLKSEIAQHIDLEMKYTFDEVYDLGVCIEERLASIKENENLLCKDSLECVETVLDENDLDQFLIVPCIDAMVKECVCIKSDLGAQNVEILDGKISSMNVACDETLSLGVKVLNEKVDSCEMLPKCGYGTAQSTCFESDESMCDVLTISVGNKPEIVSNIKASIQNQSRTGSLIKEHLSDPFMMVSKGETHFELGSQLVCSCEQEVNKSIILVYDPGGTHHKMLNQVCVRVRSIRIGLVYHKDDYNLVFGSCVHDVVLMLPRYFMMIFDPGGADVSPPIEVAFEHVILNLLNSFNKVHNNVIRICLLRIKSWCMLWSVIIMKFEDKFLLNLGRLQRELEYRHVIFQSTKVKMQVTIPETIPPNKEHQNRTFCFDFRIMVILFAPYLEF